MPIVAVAPTANASRGSQPEGAQLPDSGRNVEVCSITTAGSSSCYLAITPEEACSITTAASWSFERDRSRSALVGVGVKVRVKVRVRLG